MGLGSSMVWNNCWRNLTQNAIDWCLHNNHTHAQITVFHSVHGVCYSSSWTSGYPLRIPPKDRLYWCFFFSKISERNPNGSGCDYQHWKGKVMYVFSNVPNSSWKIFMDVLFTLILWYGAVISCGNSTFVLLGQEEHKRCMKRKMFGLL